MPFIEEDDDEAMAEELKEAFRLYDKGGELYDSQYNYMTMKLWQRNSRKHSGCMTKSVSCMIINKISSDGSRALEMGSVLDVTDEYSK